VLLLLVLIPTSIYFSVKYWHRTPMGRVISPPNPVLTAEDKGVDLRELEALVGQRGRTLSPLRPVGTCEFNGRRVECEAEVGMIDSSVVVEAVGLRGRCLRVRSV
jgi:membrane-bound serine protease (ClpP class)